MKKHILVILAVLAVLVVSIFAAMAYKPQDYAPMVRQSNSKADSQLMASGDSALAAGDTEKALINYMLLCGRADSAMSDTKMSDCISAHIKVGDIYYDAADYASALGFFLKGLELSDKLGTKPFMALLYKDIGNVYNMFEEHEQAIRQYREALKYSNDDPVLTMRLYNNLVTTYAMIHDLKNARLSHEKAGKVACDDPTSQFLLNFNYALLLHEEGRYAQAADLLKQTANYARQHSLEPRYECSSYAKLYKVYDKLGLHDSTLMYLNKCLDMAEKEQITRLFAETYRDMADFYEAQGDTKGALQMRSRYMHLTDSIFDKRQFDMLKNRQLMYETEKTDRVLREQKERERRHNELIRWQWAVIIIVVVAAVAVGVLLIVVYRKKNKLNASYTNLYKVNRSYAVNYRKALERERSLQEDLEASHKRIDELEAALKQDARPTESHAAAVKYSSSRLDRNRHNELLNKISQVMADEKVYCNADFSLNALATAVESNSRYVSQVINEAYGKNFSNYVNEFRIRTACERFTDTDKYGMLTVSAIGESVGFKSHTTFLTVFKKITGMTPSVYARLAREQEGK